VPEEPVSFADGQSSLEELSGASPALVNFLVDAGNALHQRPGITTWADFPATVPDASAVIGIYAWRQFIIYVTADRRIWCWEGSGNVVALSSATDTTTQLDGTARPVFAYDTARVVITGGGAAQKWEGSGLSARLGGSPPNATHIAYNEQRLVINANDNSGIIYWTPPGVGNHEIWDTTGDGSAELAGAGFSEAEAAPDPVVALYANSNEVFAFGTQTTQVFAGDPSGFVVVASVGIGNSAPYSIIDTDASFAWLDEHRRFVYSSGRDFQVLSSPTMAKSIGEIATVSDCWGVRIRIGSYDLLVWQFPTEGRTLWYDRDSKKWGEWRSFDGAKWIPWIVQSYFYWPDQNLHLVGLSDGRIAVLTFDAFLDDVHPIKAVSRTGFHDRGTLVRKQCNRIQAQLKRGATVPTATAPTVELRYRDDLGAFKQAKALSLGAGDYQPVIDAWAVGMYRQRQWEITFIDNAEFVLTQAKETFTPAES
jgi:hypothetical protein